MVNELLIILLNYKIDNMHCKQCIDTGRCYFYDIFYIKKDIENVIEDLKEGKI